MTKHIRRVILEDLRGQLKAVAFFSNRCKIMRLIPGPPYPVATVYADFESVETLTIHSQSRPQDRSLTIAVNAWILGTSDDEKAENDLDAAALAIEQALQKSQSVPDIRLVDTDFQVSEDEPLLHVVTLKYLVEYTSSEFNPAA